MEYTGAFLPGARLLERLGRLADRSAPAVAAVLVALFSAASVEGFMGVPTTLGKPLTYAIIGAAAVSVAVSRRLRWPLFVTAAVAWLVLALWTPVLVASYYAGTSLRRRSQLSSFLVGAAVVWVVSLLVGMAAGGYRYLTTASFPNAVFYPLFVLVLPLVFGLWVSARRQVFAGLRERAERLEREQAARADQARSEERSRIAREMHDVVAHRVSLMVLHAGALEVNSSDEQTVEEARLIRTTGREALTNLRDVLGVLRSPDGTGHLALAPPPVLVDLDGLIEQSRSAGVPVTRRDEGPARRLPTIVEQTAYRVVQEGLTNVHKHAAGASTCVVLRYAPDSLEVAVRNVAPPRPVEPLPGSRLGLVGLRERVELLGGRLTAGPTEDGGFTLVAELPADPVEDPA